MQSELLGELRAREITIRRRWADLLRAEPVNTPLAHPDALAHLIDWTLTEILDALATGSSRRRVPQGNIGAPNRSLCLCGRNPLLAYFDAADQALREALILAQASAPLLDPVERDAALEELNLVLSAVAHREIEAFCGVCQHRLQGSDAAPCPSSPGCADPAPALPSQPARTAPASCLGAGRAVQPQIARYWSPPA